MCLSRVKSANSGRTLRLHTSTTVSLFCVLCCVVCCGTSVLAQSTTQTQTHLHHHTTHEHQEHHHLPPIDHGHNSHQHDQHTNPRINHLESNSSFTSPNVSTHHSATVITASSTSGNASHSDLDDTDEDNVELLHRFNRRFESMRRCQLPDSACECLWNLKLLRGIVDTENDSAVSTDTRGTNGSSSMSGGHASVRNDWNSLQTTTQQLATVMLANVLRLGSLTGGSLQEGGNANEASKNQDQQWFKCVPTENICQYDNEGDSDVRQSGASNRPISTYVRRRVEILSMLMPNMAQRAVAPRDGDHRAHEEHHSEHGHNHLNHEDNESHKLDSDNNQDHRDSDDLLNSIELLTDIEDLLRKISQQLAIENVQIDQSSHVHASLSRQNDDKSKKCFDREDLLDDLRQQLAVSKESPESANHRHENENINLIYIEYLASFIVDRLTSGECIELFETKFLRDILSRYGTKDEASTTALNSSATRDNNQTTLHINRDGFVKLLNDLHIGGLIENNDIDRRLDHDGDHDHDHHEHHHEHYHNEPKYHVVTSRGHRSISSTTPFSNSATSHHHNHIEHSHQHHQPKSSGCLDYRYYLNRQGTSQKAKVLTENDLRVLSPIFIQQILSGACEQLESRDTITPLPVSPSPSSSKVSRTKMNTSNASFDATSSQHADEDTVWQVYIYSSIAVFIISVSSICGVLLIPFLKSQYYNHLINLLIGLAFGCMAGDALFHLLPYVLGMHSHSSDDNSNDHDHDHDHEHNESGHRHGHGEESHSHGNYLWFMVAILATIYALFLFEIFSNFFASKRKGGSGSGDNGHGHGHSHSHQQPNFQMSRQKDSKSVTSVPTLTKITNNHDNSSYSSSLTIDSTVTTQASNDLESHNHAHTLQLYKGTSLDSVTVPEPDRVPPKENIPVLFGMTSLALIITIGDSIHNLLDGVAIGIAFSNSIASGISTSIAVFCHELPHEFGDFAVLLSTGLSVRRAALINFVSALTAFIGLYIGILLGNNDDANRWALAICAGLFLYVALVDMLPELKEMPSTEKGNSEWYISMLVKNAGILLGTGFMIVLAQYEHLLNFA